MENREAELGFAPQKELAYSKLLPYADVLDEESNEVLAEIKENLAKSVQLRDIKIGTSHWAVQLSKYIRIYGFKFSKEDHLYFVHLMYRLATGPNVEYSLVQKFGGVLCALLKKDELLSRDDLVLPWRPLFELMENTIYSTMEQHGLQLLPPNFENTMKGLLKSCRTYFSDESTAEMLEEWRPLLCPFDVTVIRGLSYCELFLPTTLPPKKHHMGFKLWLDEILDLWYSFHNCPAWEASIVNLFARATNDNIGYIDWKPHLPMIFTRILRSFNLPVGSKQVNYTRTNGCYETQHVAIWIIAMLGDGDMVLQHIQKLFRALHSFVHPSNTGRWSLKLSSFLQTLPFLLVKRVHRERYMKPNWKNVVREGHKLKEEDLTQFVEMMKPEVFTAMFGKYISQDASIRNLTALRAEIIMPPLLEKMYPAMETLIEPHRLLSCMFCVVSATRPMLSNRKHYPDGPNHIIPLLQLALPGIDPNDFKKTLVTLQMVSTFSALVPIVDCSEAPQVRSDLTEQEVELCSATAQFEDFVMEFLNRIMSMIENSSQDAPSGVLDRLTTEQSMLEVGLASTVTSVLQQCSRPIFMSALHKINRFLTENVFETKVSGRLASNLGRACTRVRPEETLKCLLPRLCEKINDFAAEHPGIATEERLDNSFLWDMMILSQLMRCNGRALLPYKDTLLKTLRPVLSLQNQQGYEIGGQMLRFLLRAICLTYPKDFRSVPHSLDKPLAEYLPIRDWAVPGDVQNLNMEWYVPDDDTVQFAQSIAQEFLAPHLEFVSSLKSSSEVSKEDLQRRLHIILEFILGAGALLPTWKGDPVQLKECQVSLNRFCCKTMKVQREILLGGKNVRGVIADAMQYLLRYMTTSREDDTQSMFKIIQIYDSVMMYHGNQKNDVDTRSKSFHAVKAALQNYLNPRRKHIRPVLVDRVTLLHEVRTLSSHSRVVTEKHMELLKDLLQLSVSRYREVRKRAQSVLHTAFTHFHYSYFKFITPLVTHLKNPDVAEHTFKGALHMILGLGNKRSLAIRRNWETLSELWPAIAQAQYFEKPSILRLVDDIITKVVKSQETISIEMQVSPDCLELAGQILKSSSAPRVKSSALSPQELEGGLKAEKDRNARNKSLYFKLVEELVSLVDDGKLTWKFNQNAMEFLTILLRDDIHMPVSAVRLFSKHCVDDLIYMRKMALASLSSVVRQYKRKRVKVPVDIAAVSGTTPCFPGDALAPGDRPDNQWHQYDSANLVDTKEKWESTTFIAKTHLGYYCWPRKLLTYAESSQQPKFLRSTEEMPESERVICDRFMDAEFVEKLLQFLALEEQKGRDKFQLKNYILFKGLFRNFGDKFVPVIRPHLERLVKDTSHDKHDSSQRCAMEILAGLLRGSKHWPFDSIQAMYDWVLPLLYFVRSNITVETVDDWGTFFSTLGESRDPRQLHFILELLMKSPINGEGGAFGDSSRLLMMQQGILQQEWRLPQVLHRILEYITPHLDHPYKAVRDRLGSLMTNVFLFDYRINSKSSTRSPQRSDFLRSVLPQLDLLKDVQLDKGDGAAVATEDKAASDVDKPASPMDVTVQPDGGEGEEEEKRAIRLCKTILTWLNHTTLRGFDTLTKDVLPILPVICNLLSAMNDEDLRLACKLTLTNLSASLMSVETLPAALHAVKEAAGLMSWHARVAILHFVQVFVFGNFFLMQTEDSQTAVRELLLHLLCDERLEVREVAAMTLSGAMHCGFLQMNSDMLSHFEHLRRVKLKKRQAATGCADSLEKLIKRHAGVLGLSACVQAHPYDVPDFIPQVLMDLSIHVNDPQPIQMTVKKTLSDFRRTHHDNWHDHKQMFTDDQLVVLTDLLISPNYYA